MGSEAHRRITALIHTVSVLRHGHALAADMLLGVGADGARAGGDPTVGPAAADPPDRRSQLLWPRLLPRLRQPVVAGSLDNEAPDFTVIHLSLRGLPTQTR